VKKVVTEKVGDILQLFWDQIPLTILIKFYNDENGAEMRVVGEFVSIITSNS
jgi:hypothetical protein